MTKIPQTNIFLVAAFATSQSRCYDSTSCHCQKTCSTNSTCECPCTKYLDYNYCDDVLKNRLIPTCSPPSVNVSSRPPLPPNTADLPNCFNPKCDEIESESSCRKTFGCSWCKWEESKEREIPFCSYDNDCYGGVLNRKNPFIRELGPKTTDVAPTEKTTLFSTKNLPTLGVVAGSAVLLILIISTCIYCCCCQKKEKEPSGMDAADGYYPGAEMDEAMCTQGYQQEYSYEQEGYFDEGYEPDEYRDYDEEF